MLYCMLHTVHLTKVFLCKLGGISLQSLAPVLGRIITESPIFTYKIFNFMIEIVN